MKIIFANQLRGIAAIMVVMSHYLGSFFYRQDLVSARIGSDSIPINKPWYADFILNIPLNSFNFGPLGVSIFFLISGFVILFSLNKLTPYQFIIQRFFRIYPLYWASLLIGFIVITISFAYWGRLSERSIDVTRYLANALLINSAFDLKSVDFVNWTLEIEIKFYILCAALTWLLRKPKGIIIGAVFFASVVISIYMAKWFFNVNFNLFISLLLSEFKYIIFMFIGMCFYLRLNKIINWLSFISLFATFYFSFISLLILENNEVMLKILGYNYTYGVFVFSLCYAFRSKFKNIKIFDFFANIAYPLYLNHAIIGYATMMIMLHKGFDISISILVAAILSISISYLLHVYLENRSNQLGKRLTKKLAVS